jgi:Pvc16 N-terminal domain
VSNALGISAVTAALESMLWSVYNGSDWSNSNLGAVTVTAVAPDIVQSNLGTATTAGLRVNLFLHQVTFNAAWRNMGLASLAADGITQLKNPPLALDLHYLLTVYGSEDCEAEALLGYALQFFHEYPVLGRVQIRSALSNLSNPQFDTAANLVPTTSLFSLVGASGIADQIEMLKITPATLGREEMAWLWTALKADYRPTFPFQVSVLLIQPQIPAVSALPVLQRSITIQSNLTATLTQVSPPNSQPAACLPDTVTVTGAGLANVQSVTVTNTRLGVALQILPPFTNSSDTSFQFTLSPTATPTNLPAGVYLVAAQLQVNGQTVSTNAVPLAVAPQVTALTPASPPLTNGSEVAVTVTCTPDLFVGQQVSLLIGSQEGLLAAPITAPSGSLQFVFATLQSTAGATVPLRLRVDGIDSPIIDTTAKPPKFYSPSDPPTNFIAYVEVN